MRTHHFHNKIKERKETETERYRDAVIWGNDFHPALTVKLNLKSLIMLKKLSQVRKSENLTLGSVTIGNLCHPDCSNISLMTECELGDTSKRNAIRVVDESTIQDFPFPLLVRSNLFISLVITFFYKYYKQFKE